MKKYLALILVVAIALCMAGCCCISTKKCELCEDGIATKELELSYGTYDVCDDCYDLFNFDFDFGYDYGLVSDYDYVEAVAYCVDCGTALYEDRLYCSRCLGYGTCQDCGQTIDGDRLYCDRCLGYGTCQDCGKSIDDDRLYCDSCLFDY